MPSKVHEARGQPLARVQRTGVIGPERPDAAIECLPVQGLRLLVVPEQIVEVRKIAHTIERRRVTRAIEFQLDRESLAHQEPGLVIPLHQREIAGEVVHLGNGRGRLLSWTRRLVSRALRWRASALS
jgi:hypothetical protein